MSGNRYTVAALARFADTVGSLTDRQTWATNLRTAIRTMLRHTSLAAEQDVRALDVDEVLDSFARRARGDLSPTSINTYDTNFRRAVRRFVAHADGLPAWDHDERPDQGPRLLTHTLALRPDLSVRLRLPVDLTAAEARRLTRFIDALTPDPATTDLP